MPILHTVVAGVVAGVAFTAGAGAYEKHLAQKVDPFLPLLLLIGLGFVLFRERE